MHSLIRTGQFSRSFFPACAELWNALDGSVFSGDGLDSFKSSVSLDLPFIEWFLLFTLFLFLFSSLAGLCKDLRISWCICTAFSFLLASVF